MSAVREYLKLVVDSLKSGSDAGNLNIVQDGLDITNQFVPMWIVYVQCLNENEDTLAQSLYDSIMDLINVPTEDTDRNLTITQQKTLFAYK